MDNDHLSILKKSGVRGWNNWRKSHPDIVPDFRYKSLYGLFTKSPSGMAVKGLRAHLAKVNFSNADLSHSFLEAAMLDGADLTNTNLDSANLSGTQLVNAKLNGAILKDANLRRANLTKANLTDANLMYAQLNGAILKGTDLTNANIYGISAWNVQVDEETHQSKLLIQNYGEPTIRVPSLDNGSILLSTPWDG